MSCNTKDLPDTSNVTDMMDPKISFFFPSELHLLVQQKRQRFPINFGSSNRRQITLLVLPVKTTNI